MTTSRSERPRGGIWDPSLSSDSAGPGGRLHTPVLLQESIDALNFAEDAVVVDATLGEGGHAKEILNRLSSRGKLIGIERDPRMLAALTLSDPRLIAVEGNFKDTARILKSLNIDQARAILADIGISGRHYRTPEWGFSFTDGPLDMRLSPDGPDAAEIVNGWDEHRLAEWFMQAGERHGRKIAKVICARRAVKQIERTAELAVIVRDAVGGGKSRSHPATKVFRALREAVTGEMDDLRQFIPAASSVLYSGGRLAILVYTWEEERVVRSVADALVKGCVCPPKFPVCRCGRKPELRWVSRKGILPKAGEMKSNPSARSAKLVVLEKVEP